MIIDLKLPGCDGLSVLKEIRAKNPKAKVIIITAYPSIETAKEAMRRGATDYLPKPFELDYLETIIKQSYEREQDSQRLSIRLQLDHHRYSDQDLSWLYQYSGHS